VLTWNSEAVTQDKTSGLKQSQSCGAPQIVIWYFRYMNISTTLLLEHQRTSTTSFDDCWRMKADMS
jgi:hypothetical protein